MRLFVCMCHLSASSSLEISLILNSNLELVNKDLLSTYRSNAASFATSARLSNF